METCSGDLVGEEELEGEHGGWAISISISTSIGIKISTPAHQHISTPACDRISRNYDTESESNVILGDTNDGV